MSQVQFTSAQSGTGKTYRRCAHFLVNEWLPNYAGVHYSNFPIKKDELLAYAKKKWPKMDHSKWEDRIQIIPKEVMDSWKGSEFHDDDKTQPKFSGPWEYFADKDLSGAWIAIDEIHNFVTTKEHENKLKLWRSFTGDLRHRRVISFECISQYETKVATLIRHEAGLRRYLINRGEERNYFTGIKNADLWEWVACMFSSLPEAIVNEIEQVEQMGKMVTVKTLQLRLVEDYYNLYDSYSQAEGGGKAGSEDMRPYKTLNRWQITCWLFRRNFYEMGKRILFIALILWMAFGGLSWVIQLFLAKFQAVGPAAVTGRTKTEQKIAAAPGASDVGLVVVDQAKPSEPRLVAIGNKYCVFAGFSEVRGGEPLPWDPSRFVVAINALKRSVTLSSGEILWLGH